MVCNEEKGYSLGQLFKIIAFVVWALFPICAYIRKLINEERRGRGWGPRSMAMSPRGDKTRIKVLSRRPSPFSFILLGSPPSPLCPLVIYDLFIQMFQCFPSSVL